jgi:hypothetical protein
VRTIVLFAAAATFAFLGWSPNGRRSLAPAATPRAGAVVYTKGASTDPYGTSRPKGFGIVIAPATSKQRILKVTDPDLGWYNGAVWLGDHRIVVPRNAPPFRPPLIYRFGHGTLRLVGPAPVPRLEIQPVWSPNEKLIATEPIAPCDKRQPISKCYRSSARILVRRADGSHPRQVATGQLNGWTPDGRLLFTNRSATSSYEALDIESGRRSQPISPRRLAILARRKPVLIGPPRWSGDRRYIAAMIRAPWKKQDKIYGAFVIARADGRVVRVVRSPYVISMFAWSPRGHRLAYTTSGFPSPHQLFLVDAPGARPIEIFATRRHFDWITWSPDGRRLLLDDKLTNRWRLFSVGSRAAPHTLRRPGGRPLWCCPVNSYATNDW